MIELLSKLSINKGILFLFIALSIHSHAAKADDGIMVSQALQTAQEHTPGKVVAHEEVHELIHYPDPSSEKNTQPVYRIKILSTQGVMKTILVHRKTGKVVN